MFNYIAEITNMYYWCREGNMYPLAERGTEHLISISQKNRVKNYDQ